MKRKALKKLLIALLCAAAFSVAALLGVFYQADQMLSDSLYQQPKALEGKIFVVGIDERAMEDIGCLLYTSPSPRD